MLKFFKKLVMQIIQKQILKPLPDLNLPPLLTRLYASRKVTSLEQTKLTLSKLLSYQDLKDIDFRITSLCESFFFFFKIMKSKEMLVPALVRF